jgi:hypothetical protein
MPVPQALVTRFVQLLLNRQFTEAERELERIKQKMHKTEWNRGYFRALYGMMLARKGNGDGYAFFSKLDLTDKTALHGYRREFMNHLQSKLHGEFDRGYFSAWTDCMRVLTRIDVSNIPNAGSLAPSNGKLETVKADQSQATIENFVKQEED